MSLVGWGLILAVCLVSIVGLLLRILHTRHLTSDHDHDHERDHLTMKMTM